MLGAALVTTLSACDENAWNDEYLEGFETPTITKKETVEYTMTAADIKRVANMPANKALARERGESALLEAVGRNGFFTSEITPEYYAPAWLDSISGVKGSIIYWLSEKSTLKLSFPTSDALPAELTGIQEGENITISEEQYQEVWGSETDFAEAFAPSKPAAKAIPGLLLESVENPAEGDFAVVTYNVASQDPVFGGSTTPEPEPEFEMSNTIASIKIGEPVEAAGIVTAVCKRGIVLTDLSGSIFVDFVSIDLDQYAVGQQRKVTGKGGCFGGCLEIIDPSDELVGTQEYTYPEPIQITGPLFEQYSTEYQAKKAANSGLASSYAEIKGAVFSSTTNDKGQTYINFDVPGADKSKAQGSGYQIPSFIEELLDFGNPVDVRGYLIGCSGKAFVTFLVTEVNGVNPGVAAKATKADAISSRAGVALSSVEEKAVYKFNGSAWALCNDVLVLNAQDYAQMGVTSNLTSAQAAENLPIYMATKFPYAKEDATYYIVYNFKNGDNTIKNFTSRATFTGTEWAVTTVNTDMMQFVRAGKGDGWSNWVYDPSVYIDLPAGKGSTSAPFWQACVDWVYENVDGPEFGSTSIDSGIGYVTSYGNNDYYTGASAYQCNIDLRAASARKQVPSVYGDMSDDDVVATMKKNFEEKVGPAILAQLYPDAQPGKGVDLYYVLSFVMYNGSSHDEVIRFLVTAPGTFEFVDCTWNEE